MQIKRRAGHGLPPTSGSGPTRNGSAKLTCFNVTSAECPLNPASLADLGLILDNLESEGGEQIDGPSSDITTAIDAIEEAIVETPATTPADREWLLLRLARAEANGWSIEARAPLVEALAVAYESEFAD